MKRDMDLARRILMEMEKAPFDSGAVQIEIEGVDPNVIQYHLLLLNEASLIAAIDASSLDGVAFIPTRLTWEGHEFLDAARNETLWAKAKGLVLNRTGGLTFDVLLAVLKQLATQRVLGTDTS